MNINGLNKTRWTNNGDFMIDDYKMIYAGGDKHEKGVGLLLDGEMARCLMGYWTVSERTPLSYRDNLLTSHS